MTTGTAGHADHVHDDPPPGPVPDLAALEHGARILSALGDAERLRLLHLLSAGERCVSELVVLTGARTTTVSQRLRVLRDHHLVASRRDGRHIYYRQADHHVQALLDAATDHVGEIS